MIRQGTGDEWICDRCGVKPREITIFGLDLCGWCYARYASELVAKGKEKEREQKCQRKPKSRFKDKVKSKVNTTISKLQDSPSKFRDLMAKWPNLN